MRKKKQIYSPEVWAEVSKMRKISVDGRFRPAMLYHRLSMSEKAFKRVFLNNEQKYDRCWVKIQGRSNVRKIRFKMNEARRLCDADKNARLLEELKSKLVKP